MSSYSRLVFLTLFIFTGCSNAAMTKISQSNSDDYMIMMALDYELHQNVKQSSKLYTKLYYKTKSNEYLQKAVTQSLIAKDYKTTYKLCTENLDKRPETNERFYRLAVISSLQLLKLDDSLRLAKILLKKYNNILNYEVIANVYYARAEYKKAIEYFESTYAKNQKANTLVSLVNILYSYMNEKKKAVSYLETYIRLYGCDDLVCDKLVVYYREQQNIDGMISILKMQFKVSKSPRKIYEVSNLLINSLERRNINDAILFLEKYGIDDVKLLLLYEKVGSYKKALKLVRSKYMKTKKKELLAQIAIFEYESALNKKNILKHVIANFELALQVSDDASYKNYYGYILIEHNINAKKGLKLVKEALLSSPTNLAYADSVAWGYYKLNKCKKANKYMKEIVNQIGLDNKEIKLHWEKIQKCQKY